jgi:hypothetical protein
VWLPHCRDSKNIPYCRGQIIYHTARTVKIPHCRNSKNIPRCRGKIKYHIVGTLTDNVECSYCSHSVVFQLSPTICNVLTVPTVWYFSCPRQCVMSTTM